MIQKDNIQEFRVLDLFSGAGGFSYGMEKNTHFKTVIALDFNEHSLMDEFSIIDEDYPI